MDKISFELSSPIKVQSNSEGKNTFVELNEIYLIAPSYKHKDYTLVLKKGFIEATVALSNSLTRQQAEKGIDNNEKIDAKAVKAILYAAKGFDIVDYFKKFESFIIADIAFKDKDLKQPLKRIELEKLSEQDFEELLAKYFEVFMTTSWMKTLG